MIATAIFLAYIAIPYFGNKALIVRSGSMQPAIGVGDLVVVRENENLKSPTPGAIAKYKVDDVVAFASGNDSKVLTTHRVVEVEIQEGQVFYQTQGDANNAPDQKLVKQNDIVGKSYITITGLGKLFSVAKTREGFLALVIFPAILVIIFEIVNIVKEVTRLRNKKNEDTLTANYPSGNIMLRILFPFLIGTMFFQNSLASYADVEIAHSNLLQAAASFDPVSPSPTPSPNQGSACFSNSGGSVVINEVNWVGSNGSGLDEWVELCNLTNSPIDLTNWVVEKLGTGNGPNANVIIPSGVIPANGFFIISNNDQANSKINVASDLVDTNVSLDNGGEQLVLKDSSANVVDTANGTGAWFAGSNSTPKKSMERKNPIGVGTQSASWQTATTHTNMDASGPTDEFATPKAINGI